MSSYESFDESSQKALAYFEKEESLQTAYDMLTEAVSQFPEQAMIMRGCPANWSSRRRSRMTSRKILARFWHKH